MIRKISASGDKARDFLMRYVGLNNVPSDRELTRRLRKENPKLFPTEAGARSQITYQQGKRDGKDGKRCTDPIILKSNYSASNPRGIQLKNKHYRKAEKRKLTKGKYYIITWAQNNTKVHEELWTNIEAYQKFLKAEIHVILGRYKNPTRPGEGDSEEWWDDRVLPYADAKRHQLHKHLTLLSDIRIQPTASTPLSGMESMSGLNSAIFGHPKQQMDTIAALEGYEPKMLFTTGAITKCNYSDSKVGKKGEFHHVPGFVIVEIKDNDVFFVRQVTATSSGSFTDLIYNVKDGKVNKIREIAYANLGDKHIGEHCPEVEKQQRKLLDYFKPKHTLVHDAFNGTSVNHHEEKDPYKQFYLEQTGRNSIKREMDELFAWVESMKKYNLVFVASNHNDWLDKYLKNKDWKLDIKNSMEYMKYSQVLLSGSAPKGIIAYLLEEKFGKQIRTLSRNDSFRIKNIELASHGDIGTNGSRGSIMQFRKLSTKMDVMHTHTPRRLDGVMYGGTSSKTRMGYNKGASSHRSGDIICHMDGKRQQIFYQGANAEFTTFAL